MTKVAGRAASYAPSLGLTLTGSASAIALGTALILGGGTANAGNCVETASGSGIFTCSDAAAVTDTTEIPTGAAGGELIVTTSPGFGLNVAEDEAIRLNNSPTGTGITFTDNNASTITGATDGIRVRNNGIGALNLTTTGTVTGASGFGIDALNGATATDLTISTANVTGGIDGIRARSGGTGTVSVTATDMVTGTNGVGIDAFGGATTTGLTVSATSVTGANDGIRVRHIGTGDVNVTATGTVTSSNNDGIDARTSELGGDLTISAATVTGGNTGIFARNSGVGALNLTATGTVHGTNRFGINANGEATTTDLTVSAVSVTGAHTGILANNMGSGTLTVTTTGDVMGTLGNGIDATNDALGENLTISAAGVSGGENGISANSFGTGVSTITASGTVVGVTGVGITTVSNLSGMTNITLNSGADVSGGSGVAIANNEGDSLTTLNTGSTVTGEIRLGDGSDTLDLAGGDLTAATILDGGDDSSSLDEFVDTLIIADQSYTLAGANLINWEAVNIDGGTLDFNDMALSVGDGMAGTGVSILNGGRLDAGTTFALTGNLNTASDGIFDATGGGSGNYNINGNVTNDGVLTSQDGAVGDVITINGDYTGTGTIQIDTVLGDDTSATDLLAVTGDTAGSSVLNVENVGGGGDITTLGIEVISVGGISDGVFILDGDFTTASGEAALVAGAYAYTLVRGPDGNWSLISQATTEPDPVPEPEPVEPDPVPDPDPVEPGPVPEPDPVEPDPVPEPEPVEPGPVPEPDPVEPDPVPEPDPVEPDPVPDPDPVEPDPVPEPEPVEPGIAVFQPGAPIYEAYPRTLLALNGLPTLKQRVGLRHQTGAYVGAPTLSFDADAMQTPLWFRIDGDFADLEPSTSTTQAQTDITVWKLTAGIDFLLSNTGYGEIIGGVSLHYGTASSDVTSQFGRGSVDSEGYGIGLSATWYGNDSTYVDGQFQYSVYDSDLSSDTLGTLIDGNDGSGFSASLEVGRPYAVRPDLNLVPQAQLMYSSVDFDDFVGANGERVSLDDAESLELRLGIAAEKNFNTADGQQQVYGIFNIYHEFADSTQVDVSGVELSNGQDDWSAEIGIGGVYSWNANTSLYGEVAYATGLNNFGDSRNLSGSVGLRIQF